MDDAIEKLVNSGMLTDCATSRQEKHQALFTAYQNLLSRPECAALNKNNPPRLFVRNGGSLGEIKNAGAARNHNLIIMGFSVFHHTLPEGRKAILAHELAHILLGHSGGSTPEKERQADTLTAQLLDYDVEPFIAALESLRRARAAQVEELRQRQNEPVLDWEGNVVQEARPAAPPSWIEKIGEGIGKLLYRRTHPELATRVQYLRELEAEHKKALLQGGISKV